MTKSEIARKFRSKNPDMQNLKLARIMYAAHKLDFKDVENARWVLRYIESPKSKINAEFIRTEPRPLNPYNLPSSDEADYKPFVFKGHKRIAIFADIHTPFHNISALTAAINFTKKEKPDALLLNGDTIDCHQLSRFIKDPKKRNFKQELDTFKALFEVFEKQLKCKIYFKIGNHEERYEHFLYQKAGELVGIEEFEFSNIIKARARGIEIIADKRYMQMNELC